MDAWGKVVLVCTIEECRKEWRLEWLFLNDSRIGDILVCPACNGPRFNLKVTKSELVLVTELTKRVQDAA